MDPVQLHAVPRPVADPLGRDLEEVDAAIELVRRGLAQRVRLVNLSSVDGVAFDALAHSQRAHVRLTVDRHGLAPSITIGPRSD